MAGENILPNEHYPDYFQIVTIPFFHAMVPTGNDTLPLMYVEPRATNGTGIVIDSITYGVAVIETLADTAEIIHAATPQATTGLSLQTATIPLNVLGTATTTINSNNNFVPAGNWLILKANADLGQVHGCITIRFRSRLK
jgi:hypothetical protein